MRKLASLLLLGVGFAVSADPPVQEVSVFGKVHKVAPAERQVTIETRDGKTTTFTLDDAAQMRIEDRPARLEQFKAGSRVRIVYEPKSPAPRVVMMDTVATSGDDLGREVKDVLKAAKNYSYEKKDDYRLRLGRLADQMDDRIVELQAQARDASGEAKVKLQASIVELRAREKVLRQQMARVGASSADAWDDIRAGAGSALNELHDAFQKAWSRFK